jgi:hypothetical protein
MPDSHYQYPLCFSKRPSSSRKRGTAASSTGRLRKGTGAGRGKGMAQGPESALG